MRDVCQYPEEYDLRLQEYLKDKDEASTILQTKYANSYWNYYFLMETPDEDEQMLQSSRGHG